MTPAKTNPPLNGTPKIWHLAGVGLGVGLGPGVRLWIAGTGQWPFWKKKSRWMIFWRLLGIQGFLAYFIVRIFAKKYHNILHIDEYIRTIMCIIIHNHANTRYTPLYTTYIRYNTLSSLEGHMLPRQKCPKLEGNSLLRILHEMAIVSTQKKEFIRKAWGFSQEGEGIT